MYAWCNLVISVILKLTRDLLQTETTEYYINWYNISGSDLIFLKPICNVKCTLGRATLTGNVNRPGDEAVLPELPGLSDIYNYGFPGSQEQLQLVITHICARWP